MKQERVDRWLLAREGDLAELAARLIAFATPNPPGRNTAEAQAFVARYLSDLGCRVETFDDAASARLSPRSPARCRTCSAVGPSGIHACA